MKTERMNLETARAIIRAEHCTHLDQLYCDCDWCRLIHDHPQDVEFTAEHGFTPYEAAEMSFAAKLMDACDTDEEADAVNDYFAG